MNVLIIEFNENWSLKIGKLGTVSCLLALP